MSNIFASLKIYAGKYHEVDRQKFTAEEIAEITFAVVVPSEFGCSVEFHRKDGGKSYIPLSKFATLSVGDIVDMSKADIVYLEKDGSDPIIRIEL